MTIEEAKQFLHDNWEKGCKCPACGQHVQLYDYKLFATSAYALITLYGLSRTYPAETYFHISRYAEAEGKRRPRAPHFAELRFWGFVTPNETKEANKKASGYWAITQKGRDFVEGKIAVPSRILVFNNKFRGYSSKAEPITIKSALTNKFDYGELMSSYIDRQPTQERLI